MQSVHPTADMVKQALRQQAVKQVLDPIGDRHRALLLGGGDEVRRLRDGLVEVPHRMPRTRKPRAAKRMPREVVDDRVLAGLDVGFRRKQEVLPFPDDSPQPLVGEQKEL